MKYFRTLIDLLRIIKCLGIFQALKFFYYKSQNEHIFSLEGKGYNEPFFIRGGTTDSWIFETNIVQEEYSIFKTDKDIKRIVDAGANIGMTSRYFHRRFPEAKIVALEPSKENFNLLEQNTQGLDSILSLNAGIWSKSTKLKIVDESEWNYAFQVVEDEQNGKIDALGIVDVMDKMGWDFIDLLKLDVEGSEVEVLTNNFSDWSYKIGALLIEIHPQLNSHCAGILFNAFANRDFDFKYRGENLLLIFNDV